MITSAKVGHKKKPPLGKTYKISLSSSWSWGKKFGLEDGVPANGKEAEIIVHAD